jgi:hypothetical protein
MAMRSIAAAIDLALGKERAMLRSGLADIESQGELTACETSYPGTGAGVNALPRLSPVFLPRLTGCSQMLSRNTMASRYR